MKRKKRFLSLLLSLAVVFTMTITPALAGNETTVTVETATTAKAGDEVTLAVSIANNPGFTNFEWNIEYDNERLNLESINTKYSFDLGNGTTVEVPYINASIVSNVNKFNTGKGYITCASTDAISQNGTLFTLTFKVNDNAASGLAVVKITSDKIVNVAKARAALSVIYINGGVIVEGTGGSTTGGSTTGGSTTGGSTTGGSTTGGSTTGGSTTGSSTTGGSTTGGSTTGSSTTGGSTTGGSTTGGSTTGGSTTGGSTTGGSTTGGSTTGGSTTGGSTTGGSTTGGSTTGGSTTGGSTSGNNTPVSKYAYPIIIEDTENGDVTADHKSAAKGTTVTLTVEPDKGYTLETITATDASGIKLKLTEKDGKYTFEMPASKVYVEATFMEDNTMLNFFVDVFPGDYYYDAVLWAAENDITGGTDATHFSPNAPCTRAQAVTFLWRAAGCPAPKSSEMPFTDVAADSYYHAAVLWAVENGITKGTSDTTFSPNAKCTRAQIVTFLWRTQTSPASNVMNPFTDVAADAYYNNAVLWAVENGITSGTAATTFSPNVDCTRAQIVTFLWRCLDK